jgi:protein O-GlcNAc transferase
VPTIAETFAQAKACHLAGDLTSAEHLYQQVIQADSANVEAHFLLGAAFYGLGKANEAITSLAHAVRLQPEHAEAHNHLGAVLAQQGKLDEAILSFQQACRLRPASVEMSTNLRHALAARDNKLGSALAAQGKLDEAVACFRRAVELNPDYAEVHNNLGAVLGKQGKLDEATACFRRALAVQPGYANAHDNLGAVLGKQGKLDEAAACCRRALELKPDYAEAHDNLGAVLAKQDKFDDAVVHFRRALELKSDLAEAHNHLGLALMQQGNIDEALACFRKALEVRPQFVLAHSSILFALQYQPGTTLAQLDAAHREYDERHAAPLRASWRPHDNEPNPDRCLRLGFVSADFGFHPVGYFLVRVLENLDGRQVETMCYSNRATADAMTNRLRAAATNWREVHGLDEQQLADQIRADRIDILFDLAGHTAGNRLLAFARKPAPIQITWLGYVGTTGLEAMDYLLADRYEVPQGAEPYLRERVLRMPDGYVCYDPPSDAPAVSPLPALERGHVTFGSFNNLAKITPNVVDLWAAVLRRVTLSRLVLKYPGLDAPSVTRRMEAMFAQRGVDRGRLELLGKSSHEDLLRQYQRVDIALDPFPYNGGLTTCEALWMGVPVVTWPGETFAGRHSLSHLSNVGLLETIAGDLKGYVELAAGLAADLPRLAGIRARLRDQVAGSPLCDGQRFAENFTAILRGAWRRWCDDRPIE